MSNGLILPVVQVVFRTSTWAVLVLPSNTHYVLESVQATEAPALKSIPVSHRIGVLRNND
jgi:hypothetical protein